MKKAASAIIIVVFVLLAAIVVVAQPGVPEIYGSRIDKGLSKLCLVDIPEYYDSSYLTYAGHTKAWIYHWLDKFGIDLGKQQARYLLSYSFLEEAVNCYISTSGDVDLNISLSPTEFETAYELVANNYRISRKLR